ncbi:hypothetical protein CAPN004_08450 [Capnocytophaga cynodegmi]|uniref:S41 family peptidase n=1 Tax=Capnocytophaga cynodegmi TaxID=28189 RepID=UPI001ACD5474|nr:S41 family peptidase [Capnocytophaga cynodegmi]GIM51815.1 hypothetical protein CAPN004_08450 [Capnocytophaga cynodegmi]
MKRILLPILLIFSFLSCKKDVDDALESNLQIKDFIWKGLNTFYLWQSDVPNLADTRFASSLQQTNFTNVAYTNFLSNYKTPEELFYNLLNKSQRIHGREGAIDRFSHITDDYTKLERDFQGISLSTGMQFGLTRYGKERGILGFVQYVLPGSEAEQKGVQRGDLFLAVDGTPLTVSNYRTLLFNDKTSMAIEIYRLENVNGQPTIQKTNKSVVMAKKEITENPIFIKKVIEKGNHKIGYLMYNGFVANFDKQLNEAFGEFKSQGVTDFVLDLRYNGGGRISSAIYLASMITGQFNGQIFAKERWNRKLQPVAEKRGGVDNFFTDEMVTESKEKLTINSLNLSKIYILTSERTASASELVINGLKAYIDVVQIGDITMGKNQGSITVYDWIDDNNRNPKHKWAMQPLVLKIENAKGEGDYTSGLRPTFQMEEDLANYGVLGDEKEPLLAKAIQTITGITDKRLPREPEIPAKGFIHSKSFNFAANEMYK